MLFGTVILEYIKGNQFCYGFCLTYITQTNLLQIHWLTFTRVEEHFYQRLHAECSYDAQQRLKKFSDPKTKLSDLDRQTLSSLLHPLLKLRQACNHPQVNHVDCCVLRMTCAFLLAFSLNGTS